MKKLLFFIAGMACACNLACAGELVRFQNTWTTVYTNIVFSSNLTASATFTNSQNTANWLNHTFHFPYSPTGTNTTTLIIERTVDSSTWVPVQTNTLTGGTNSFEYTATGKWAQYRFRVTGLGTNATISAAYIAQ